MDALIIAALAGVGFLVAYHTYGRWLGRKIFELSAQAVCPSVRLRDGVDYVPTPKAVVFGHHFTSIAGTGPIVGPAIAVLWGWLPALLWVVFGSIFIGAVHDLGALVVSLRNNGQTVGDIAGRLLNGRTRLLFLLILLMALTVVLAIFGLVIATVFKRFPASIFPCLVQIPIATAIGYCLYRRGGKLLWPSLGALALMYLTVIWGDAGMLHQLNATMANWSILTWVVILLVYSYVASVLPVWMLLQPRDYINSLQLISALALILAGLAVAALWGGPPLSDGTRPALSLAAPMFNPQPTGAPLLFPFLFITVACGAISGFHCLVSSGTSSKQLRTEPDARLVGYGGMLTEGFLAVLVLLACAAGLGLGFKVGDVTLTGQAAWAAKYESWSLVSKGAIGSFVQGSANFLESLGITEAIAVALMGVLVASFAGTTMDTACRLQRYVIQELAAAFAPGQANPRASARHTPLRWLRNKHGATLLAIALAAVLASAPAPGQPWSLAQAGQGGLILWPLFGATNQLLGGLAFVVISFYLWRRSRPVWFLILPALFMLVMPLWAMTTQLFFGSGDAKSWLDEGHWLLVAIALGTIALEIWMIVEAVALFPRAKGVLEQHALDSHNPPLAAPQPQPVKSAC
ncbi:MAG: carbon starvation protein A [Verrucomicrobia bacterium]|nr:carbon starvation protein A [Verrucomicrobiota bacterium]